MRHTSSNPTDPGLARRLRVAEAIYQARRRRRTFFDDDALFGEPAYDIMLDLYVAAHKGLEISVSSACIAADVPSTTALRYVTTMQEKGWVARERDPFDRRRHLLKLTEKGRLAMDAWLERNIADDSLMAEKSREPEARSSYSEHGGDEIVPTVMRVDDRVYTFAESSDGLKTGFFLTLAVARSLGYKLIEMATGRAHQGRSTD